VTSAVEMSSPVPGCNGSWNVKSIKERVVTLLRRRPETVCKLHVIPEEHSNPFERAPQRQKTVASSHVSLIKLIKLSSLFPGVLGTSQQTTKPLCLEQVCAHGSTQCDRVAATQSFCLSALTLRLATKPHTGGRMRLHELNRFVWCQRC
jgi:hypothetical protein